ncbi:hypothetical protein BN000_02872 [Neobacillus massiliamazoniensis]|uniref:Uncharacterized protein n=1 Tax=Neobacillus massiliamazoniensis TaxID=1499688 RepID=A0A0U1NY37_9BACI|nr:hypothetical protein BN000_02872 [Neobacillus massiliamazoniensis]
MVSYTRRARIYQDGDNQPHAIKNFLEDTLLRLGLEYIDLY